MNNNIIELLAPAGNADIGRAAIDAGADAVYIGGELFSARAAAGNSIEQIESLCRYAHQFGAKVYLALNTLLDDQQEVEAAEKLALAAIEAGIDAIIFQDVRILDMGLPIEMHASTQTFNRTVERVQQLEQAGCSRVVLERALSIDEIRAIAQATNIEIEVFIHGAICVAYSGICTLSEHLAGRSGNRGQCAQPCRSRYDLVDADELIVIGNKTLLSPRDMNLSARIAELVQAGVRSLKIEGRLKEKEYVQNTVSHYDNILHGLGVRRPSYGRSEHQFTPDPRLSFNRGFTEWFADGVSKTPRSCTSAKPPGEPIGRVIARDERTITVKLNHGLSINNGDGICFSAASATGNEIKGVRVNRAEGNRLHLLSTESIAVGAELYRNSSITFNPSSTRQIEIDISIDNQSITATDDYGHTSRVAMPKTTEIAQNADRAIEMLRSGLSKTGGTIFSARAVEITCDPAPFLASAEINALRRKLLDQLQIECSTRPSITSKKTTSEGLSNNANPEFLMRSRFCILRENDMCLKTTKLNLPLRLRNNNRVIDLKFDCANCEMFLLS